MRGWHTDFLEVGMGRRMWLGPKTYGSGSAGGSSHMERAVAVAHRGRVDSMGSMSAWEGSTLGL